MARAGDRILECYRLLGKNDANVVGEVLKGHGEFFEWDHYPPGDVYDHETHAQYYYHAHPPEGRAEKYGLEHGHFHTFLRPKGMPKSVKPAKVPDYKKPEGDNDELTHFVGISMDRAGFPIRLFTTNRYHVHHHSRVLEESNTNYGCAIILWDRLFGTYSNGVTTETGTGPTEPSLWQKFQMPFVEPDDTATAPGA